MHEKAMRILNAFLKCLVTLAWVPIVALFPLAGAAGLSFVIAALARPEAAKGAFMAAWFGLFFPAVWAAVKGSSGPQWWDGSGDEWDRSFFRGLAALGLMLALVAWVKLFLPAFGLAKFLGVVPE